MRTNNSGGETIRFEDVVAEKAEDRRRGVLTQRDREFLQDPDGLGLSENAKRQKRYQIRQRFFHGIQDSIYLTLLDAPDITWLNERLNFSDDDVEPMEARAWAGVYSLMFHMRLAYGDWRFLEAMKGIVETAHQLTHAEEEGEYVDVDAYWRFEVGDRVPLNEFITRRNNGEDIPPDAEEVIRWYLRHGDGEHTNE